MAVGGLGGGVLVPWSLSKLRAKGPEAVNIVQTPSSVPSATRTEDTPTDPKLTENPSIEVLKVPQQAPDSRPPPRSWWNWQLHYIKWSAGRDEWLILKQY